MQHMQLSRRKLLAAAGITAAASLLGPGEAEAASAVQRSSTAAAPPVHGLHLQFGADASSGMVVSWHTLQPVNGARVVLGRPDGKLERTVAATATSYLDAKSNRTVFAYHAKLTALQPGRAYMYAALRLDPGTRRGGYTTIAVTYYDVIGNDGELAPFETFTLRRPRRD